MPHCALTFRDEATKKRTDGVASSDGKRGDAYFVGPFMKEKQVLPRDQRLLN